MMVCVVVSSSWCVRCPSLAELGGAYYRADNTFQAQQQSTAAALETREKEAQAMQGLERHAIVLILVTIVTTQ